MEFSVFFDKGNNRENNEDNYLILNDNEIFSAAAVADGMGGHSAGEVASKIAIDLIKDYDFNFKSDIINDVKNVVNKANQKIIDLSREEVQYQGMGTTFSLGLIYKKELYFGHIGDSRIYLFRDNHLSQLTCDHTLVNKLIRENKIKKEEAFNHPKSHILTQALGLEEDININTGTQELEKNDLLLWCTDGLTDMIKPDNIEIIIQENSFDIKEITDQLGEKALQNGGKDNLTIITGIIN